MNKRRAQNEFDINLLNRLIEDEESCVEAQKKQHHLALHPFHLNEISTSIKDILDKGIRKYSSELEGILFGYKNVKLLSELGTICDDFCFIHVDIEADFFIFKPVVGNILKGTVNKKSKDHVGCLVHNVFNVSLPKPEDEEDWVGSDITLTSEVLFKVLYTNFEGRLPYIRGQIESVLYNAEDSSQNDFVLSPSDKKNPKLVKRIKFETPRTGQETKKKAKKSKKHKEKEDDEISLPDLNLSEVFSSGSLNSLALSNSSVPMADDVDKKKRKPSVSLSLSKPEEINIPTDTELESLLNSSNEKPRKKRKKESSVELDLSRVKVEKNVESKMKKKRKREELSPDPFEFEEELSPPVKFEKASKKRKKLSQIV